jgi:hypothetical protein
MTDLKDNSHQETEEFNYRLNGTLFENAYAWVSH